MNREFEKSKVNHRIAIRNTINCVLFIVIVSIIYAMIVIIINTASKPTTVILIIYMLISILYIILVIFWIAYAIKKNNQATKYDRNIKV